MTKLADSTDSSTSFDNEETQVRKFAKTMLKSSLFIGTFIEKRYVEPLNAYRDVIKISDEESDLIENLRAVRKRCSRFFLKNVWIGITEPQTIGAPAGYNLWVTLDEEVFGSYWYKIKTVEFHRNEVRIRLEVVRPVTRENSQKPTLNITPQLEELSYNTLEELNSIVSFENVKSASIFLFLLISTLLTFLVESVKYLLDYFLKLLRELSGFIKVCTPIIISFMKLIMNTINGFYTLIAIMWRDRSKPKVENVYGHPQYLSLPYRPEPRALPYYSGTPARSTVKITPLD